MTQEYSIDSFYVATDNLIEQQFYKPGTDQIIGRTPEISVKVSFSGQIVAKFKKLFNKNVSYFLNGKYMKFLEPFEKIKGMNENIIEEIHQKLQKKIDLIGDSDQFDDPIIIYTLLLSTIISTIRDVHFNESLTQIRHRAKKESINLSLETLNDRLDNLFMTNNENISILYNLSYLDALAESFNYNKVARICKIQKSKYMNRIIELLIE